MLSRSKIMFGWINEKLSELLGGIIIKYYSLYFNLRKINLIFELFINYQGLILKEL